MAKHALDAAHPTDTSGLPDGWHWPHRYPEEWDRYDTSTDEPDMAQRIRTALHRLPT